MADSSDPIRNVNEGSDSVATLSDDELSERIIGAAYAVHNTLGFGFLESVYERSLCVELSLLGHSVRRQHPIPVEYRSVNVGNFIADMVVDDRFIVELKSIEQLATIHEVQLVNYLQATGLATGLLINFGPRKVITRRKFKDFKRRGQK